jgi:uncharacterized protein YkwD
MRQGAAGASAHGHLMKPRLLLLTILAIALAAVPGPASAAADPQDEMVRLVNAVRERHGLRPVRSAERLEQASGAYARRLARRSVLQHASDYQAAGFRRVGEILAAAPRGCGMRSIVRMWRRSPAHRRIMLRPSYRFVGIGAARGRHRTRFWVARFGRR